MFWRFGEDIMKNEKTNNHGQRQKVAVMVVVVGCCGPISAGQRAQVDRRSNVSIQTTGEVYFLVYHFKDEVLLRKNNVREEQVYTRETFFLENGDCYYENNDRVIIIYRYGL